MYAGSAANPLHVQCQRVWNPIRGASDLLPTADELPVQVPCTARLSGWRRSGRLDRQLRCRLRAYRERASDLHGLYPDRSEQRILSHERRIPTTSGWGHRRRTRGLRRTRDFLKDPHQDRERTGLGIRVSRIDEERRPRTLRLGDSARLQRCAIAKVDWH